MRSHQTSAVVIRSVTCCGGNVSPSPYSQVKRTAPPSYSVLESVSRIWCTCSIRIINSCRVGRILRSRVVADEKLECALFVGRCWPTRSEGGGAPAAWSSFSGRLPRLLDKQRRSARIGARGMSQGPKFLKYILGSAIHKEQSTVVQTYWQYICQGLNWSTPALTRRSDY